MATTLTDHVRERHGEALAELLGTLAGAAIRIEQSIRNAGLSDVLGAAGSDNVQGEAQQKLDVLANETLSEALRTLPSVAAIVSEEDDEPIVFEGRDGARFIAIFDPLDGSSNIDVNVNVGTIVSVQSVPEGMTVQEAILQPGTRQIAALYVNYGPSTILVYTAGDGVHAFTLSNAAFLLSSEGMTMPPHGPYYSMNEANLAESDEVYARAVAGFRDGSLLGKKYGARYVGSFIADFHRTLLKGGVFLYPATRKAPEGKLRLLYEANPLSMIAEQAGGAATDGTKRILSIEPGKPHVRTPLVIGSKAEVDAIGRLIAGSLRE